MRHERGERLPPTIDIGGISIVGSINRRNGDCFSVKPHNSLMIVCDGLGGESYPYVASLAATQMLSKLLIELTPNTPVNVAYGLIEKAFQDTPVWMEKYVTHTFNVLKTNGIEIKAAAEDVATTVALAWVNPSEKKAVIAHVGDSRIAIIKASPQHKVDFDYMTKDHNLLWLLESGLCDETYLDSSNLPPPFPGLALAVQKASQDYEMIHELAEWLKTAEGKASQYYYLYPFVNHLITWGAGSTSAISAKGFDSLEIEVVDLSDACGLIACTDGLHRTLNHTQMRTSIHTSLLKGYDAYGIARSLVFSTDTDNNRPYFSDDTTAAVYLLDRPSIK